MLGNGEIVAQVLLIVGASIFVFLGTAHGLLTLRDLFTPRTFTPTDAHVRQAMQGARLAIHPRANLWKTWLGFNLSHSLGVLLFGGGFLIVAWRHFPIFAQSHLLQGVGLVVAATYFVLSICFWFSRPAIGCGVAFLCFLGSVILAYA